MNHQEPTTVTAFSLADVWMEREQLRAALAAARAALEAAEWLPLVNADVNDTSVERRCWWCWAEKADGHTATCERQAALGLNKNP